MVTLLHEKLVASCVEPKVFGGSLILNAPISTTTKKGGANNFGDDMPGAGAVKAQPSSNVTNVIPLNHTGMVACSVTEEATWASSCSVVEPVSGGVTADGAQLPEDVDVVKNHAMVSFPALGMSKLNARY
ncbi:hypothetical protein Bca52824_045185 [Brassica carinata]|uniref:Uncharacterized protein n=1 Tax=Brassica carinata TaxID=52824 RepID=A0A8X7RC25_BRACI|nr:hypothetical protein Bca52824_045185 [Brassica carinata]